MKKPKIFVINHGSYPFDIVVAIGASDDDVCKALEKKSLRKLDNEELNAMCLTGAGRSVMLPGGQTILRIRDQLGKAEFPAVLAHEVFHCVEFLFDRVRLKYSIDAGEAFAYQIQHLTEQIYRRL